ncbi:MAG: efflux RND transporter periplasmic adaptor subunit [Gemmatimonadaceae bacterium]|nr:efflux RND transporter periplasmic adaptor subunit [Gemmatimonadaceae bacterium]
MIRKRLMPVIVAVVMVGGAVMWYAWPATASAVESSLTAQVKFGVFKVQVTTTGELRARKFVEMQGPAAAQSVQVYQTKISTMVPEGSVVKAGDVVAELDLGPIASKLNDVALNLQKAQAEFTRAQLDSALELAQAREDSRTAEYTLEEKKIALEQARYEAPTVKRQAEIDFEKATRALAQSKRNLATKTKQAEAKMASVGADLARQQNQLKNIQEVQASFTIKAPSAGMVIYVREWNGRKKGVGSTWSPWDPTVATLPDLAQMESDTYVNEVDVRKLAVGQAVDVSLDADATKRLSGTVTHVANVGEQKPNQDSKVFEVKIAITKADTTLRPGMTTANSILTAAIPNALSIPLEALVNTGGLSYVYKKDGRRVVKQQIETGQANDVEIIVRRGLAKDDVVMLSVPGDTSGITMVSISGGKPAVSPGADTSRSVTVPTPAPAQKAPGASTPVAPAKTRVRAARS